MKIKLATILCLLICFSLVVPAFAADDPITGTWAGDWGPSKSDRNQVTVQFKYDGKTLSGTVNPGDKAVQLTKTSFDAKTGAIHLEADAKNEMGSGMVHFVIDGKLDKNTMTGSWNHGNVKGDFKISKK
jgi:hypothetical protein